MSLIYLIGSLKNENIPAIGVRLRDEGFEVFDDWYAPGPNADDHWKEYSQARGQTYKEALASYAATHIFEFDHHHLNRDDIGFLIHPAGRSGHLELGYLARDKPTFICWPDGEPPEDRWEIMVQFARGGISFSVDELVEQLKK